MSTTIEMANGGMRAVVWRGAGRTPEVETVPRPTPGPGEARLRVLGCGFCHTDLHYLDHGVPTAKPPPIVLGHEVSGRVDALGPGASGPRVGSTVLLPAVLPCGECALCRSGRENVCQRGRMVGNHLDGGFAEYVVAPAKDLVPLPPDIDPVRGAVIADALTTPYHAVVERARVQPGERVVVVGCGGVGINAVQFARAVGAEVVAVEPNPKKLEVARSLGAVDGVDPGATPDVGKTVRRRWPEGADVVVEAVGSPASIASSFSALGRGGRLCLIGYSRLPAELPAHRVMFLEQSVVGSLGCPPREYADVIDWVRAGRVRLDPVVSRVLPLERFNEAAELLRRGDGFRTVLAPGGSGEPPRPF